MSQTKAQLIEGLNINTSAPADALVIDSSGNVGIGTTSPSRALHVNSGATNEVARFESTDTEVTLELKDSTGTAFLKCRDDYRFNNNSGELVRIDSSGNVGIGTAAPGQLLHLSSASPRILLTQTSANSNAFLDAATSGVLEFSADDNNVAASSSMRFKVDGSESMRIDSSGRLLIGTTTEGGVDADNLTIADSGNCGITIRSGSSNGGSIYFSDATSGAGEYDGFVAYNQSSRFMQIGTAQSERMRIDSSGRVGIGTTSMPGMFQIHQAASNTSNYINITNDTTGGSSWSNGMLLGVTNGGDGLVWQNENQPLRFGTNNLDRMRIDSSGRVGIGITNPDAYYQHGRALVVGATGANSGITIRTGNVNQGILAFADGTTGGSQQYAGYVIYDHNVNGMLFATGATERMRINSSGFVGIGTSSPAEEFVVRADAPSIQLESSNASGRSYGVQSSNDGYFHAYDGTAGSNRITLSAAGNVGINQTAPGRALEVRDASNGNNTIIRIATQATSSTTNGFAQLEFKHGTENGAFIWQNAGATTGYAGANGMSFYLGHAADFAFFCNGNNEKVRIRNGGGITFNGDTAAANALDDYEEGAFTPTIDQGVTSPTYNNTGGSYTKIGNCVTFTIRMRVSGGTDNGSQVLIGGLPFTSSSSLREGGAFFNYRHDLNSSSAGPFMHIGQGSVRISFYNNIGGSWVGTNGSGLINRTLHIQGHYFV